MRAFEYTCNVPVDDDEIGYMITNGDRINDYGDYQYESNRRNPSLAIIPKSYHGSDNPFELFFSALSEPEYIDYRDDLPSSTIESLKLGLQGKSRDWKLVAVCLNMSRNFYFELYNFKQAQKAREMYEEEYKKNGPLGDDAETFKLLPHHVWFSLKCSTVYAGLDEVIISEQGCGKKTYGLKYYCPAKKDWQEGDRIATITEYSRKKQRPKHELTFRHGAKGTGNIIADIIEYHY